VLREERRETGRDRDGDDAGGGKRQGAREDKAEERKNRGERENKFPKDLYAISENCRGSFVKQNFPLI
jgi:hypothetical protein